MLVIGLAFFAAGCEDEPRVLALNWYSYLYLLHAQNANEAYEDEILTEDEIDCSSSLFATTEPLYPGGIIHPAIVNEGNSYWECENSNERFLPDGTWTVEPTTELSRRQNLSFQEVCGIGTAPNIKGKWNLIEDAQVQLGDGEPEEPRDYLCSRANIMPGLVWCMPIEFSEDELSFKSEGENPKILGFRAGGIVSLREGGAFDYCYYREGEDL